MHRMMDSSAAGSVGHVCKPALLRPLSEEPECRNSHPQSGRRKKQAEINDHCLPDEQETVWGPAGESGSGLASWWDPPRFLSPPAPPWLSAGSPSFCYILLDRSQPNLMRTLGIFLS